MANITSRLLTGSVDSIVLRAPNGTSLVRLPVERTPNSHVYVSQHAMNPVVGAYYLQVRYICPYEISVQGSTIIRCTL